MADLGRDFKPPRSEAVRAWRAVRSAYHLGHCLHTCGCDGPGFVPASRAELIDYLRDRSSLLRAMIATLERDTTLTPEARIAGLGDWGARLARLEHERERVHATL